MQQVLPTNIITEVVKGKILKLKKFNRNLFTFAITVKLSFNMALPLILAGIGAGTQLYNMYNSYSRQKQAEEAAAKLANTPVAQYTPNSRLLNYYQGAVGDVATPQGYTGAERGRFGSRLNEILNTQAYNATNIGGGNAARTIGAIGASNSIGALNDFAANDASLARQNKNMGYSRMANAISQLQNIDNMNTQTSLSRRLMAEQAAGEGIRSNRDMWQQGLTNLGQDLIGYGLTKSLIPTGGARGENFVREPMAEQPNISPRQAAYLPTSTPPLQEPSGYGFGSRFNNRLNMMYNPSTGKWEYKG